MERREGETAREYLERIPSFAREKSSLEDVRRFLELMDHPDRTMEIFHVAGTNGKGSVCAFLSSVLKEAGIPFGTFTSPHLVDIRERFSIGGEIVSEEDFSLAFEAVYQASSRFMSLGKPHPTYFEYLFYMGLFLFRRAGVRILVLETGMGGLKDVTNVIEEPLVCVITSISIDHTSFLGNTIEEIAAHKAGIIKPGCPVVYDSLQEQAAGVIEKTAAKKKSPAFPGGRIDYSISGDRLRFREEYRGQTGTFEVCFPAPYQARNAALAVKALSLSGLSIGMDTVYEGLKKAVWPARMERLLPNLYLDGAHNEDGINGFLAGASLLKKEKRPEKTWFLFAVSSDKEYDRMLKKIGDGLCPDICLLTEMASSRGLTSEKLLETARKAMPRETEIHCFHRTEDALLFLLSGRGEGDLCFIAGSLYLAGEIKEKTALFAEEQK